MRVLFLSVTAGHGHNQTAKAAMSYLKEKQINCTMLDTFEYINPILSESIAKGYLVSTKFTPKVYGRLYRIAEKKERSNSELSIYKLIDSILSRKLINFLNEYNPDVIICTHVFSAQIPFDLLMLPPYLLNSHTAVKSYSNADRIVQQLS